MKYQDDNIKIDGGNMKVGAPEVQKPLKELALEIMHGLQEANARAAKIQATLFMYKMPKPPYAEQKVSEEDHEEYNVNIESILQMVNNLTYDLESKLENINNKL